jgi:hypothetical protein
MRVRRGFRLLGRQQLEQRLMHVMPASAGSRINTIAQHTYYLTAIAHP